MSVLMVLLLLTGRSLRCKGNQAYIASISMARSRKTLQSRADLPLTTSGQPLAYILYMVWTRCILLLYDIIGIRMAIMNTEEHGGVNLYELLDVSKHAETKEVGGLGGAGLDGDGLKGFVIKLVKIKT